MMTRRDEVLCEIVASIVSGFVLWAAIIVIGLALHPSSEFICSEFICDVAHIAGFVFGVMMFIFLRIMCGKL